MIAHNALHGSGQAALPHPALALGDDAHAAQGIGMTDGRRRQPASDEAPHAVPQDASVLAAPRQRAIPEAPDLEPKEKQRRLVQGHSVVADMSTHHRLQPLARFRDGSVHASLKFGFHRVQLRLQPLADRLPHHRVHSIASLLHADMRKAKKVDQAPSSLFLSAVPCTAHPALDAGCALVGTRTKIQESPSKFPRELLRVVNSKMPCSERLNLCHKSTAKSSR